jgi:hypothetical protein
MDEHPADTPDERDGPTLHPQDDVDMMRPVGPEPHEKHNNAKHGNDDDIAKGP